MSLQDYLPDFVASTLPDKIQTLGKTNNNTAGRMKNIPHLTNSIAICINPLIIHKPYIFKYFSLRCECLVEFTSAILNGIIQIT